MKGKMENRTKRFLSLIFALVMVMTVIVPQITLNAWAAGETIQYTFSSYTAGTQYAENEEHVLDDNVTVIVNKGHFTTQLRLYDSTTNDSTAIIKSTKVINGFSVNAGNKAATLNVYGSTDGNKWTLINGVTTQSSYADYTVTMPTDKEYTYLKLDADGDQIRVASMTITFGDEATSGGDEEPCTHSSWTNGVCDGCSTVCEHETYENGVCTVCGATETVAPYTKATSIAVGDTVVLVYESAKMELSGISNNVGTGAEYISAPAGLYPLTVIAGSTDGTYAFKTSNNEYLHLNVDDNKLTVTSNTLDAKSSWNVDFPGDGNVTIINVNYSERQIRWNASSPRFACYKGTQQAVQLYKLTEETGGGETCTHDGQANCAEKCSLCKAELTPTANHSYSSKVTDPTCTTGGYTTYTCDACGDSYTADETPAAHNYVDGICSLCGSVAIADGNYIISTNGLTFAAQDEGKSYGYAPAGDATALAETDIITVTNVDGGFTMQDCYGRYIYMAGSYNSFNISTTAPAEGHIWQLKKSGNDLTMVNVLKQKTVAYSNEHTTWGAYAADKLTNHQYNLTLAEAPQGDEPIAYTSATTIWGQTWTNARESYAIKVLDASGNVMGTTTLNTNLDVAMDGDVEVSWHITLPGNTDNDGYWIQEWTTPPTLDNMPAKVELWVDGIKVNEGTVRLNGPDGLNKIVAAVADADGKITSYATTFADALTAAPDNGTVKLLSGPDVAISAAGEVTGNKTVTVTGTAKFDWGKGFLMVGRGSNPGDGKLIFKDATITSASSATNTAYGFNISGAKKNSDTTCNGSVELINSNIETDYLLNAGNMTVDGGNLYVHHGFKVSGRAASDSASGEDATATMTVTNGAVVKIKNENTMGIGNEGNGILNLENSTFECLSTMNIADEDGSAFNVSGTSTLNIKSVSGQSINLLDGAIIKDSTVGGDGSVDGNVTFRGNNTFNNLYDFGDYYSKEVPSMWTVEKGASLTLTNSVGNAYGLGYGDNVTVNGSLENALTARETLTEGEYSFYAEKGIRLSTSAGNDAANGSFVTVNNAYAIIGKTGSFSNSKTYGKFTIALNNSVIDAAQIFFSDSNDVIDLSISGSDVLTGIFMTADKDSTYTVNNSKMVVTASGNDRYNGNDGALTIKNSTIEIKTGTYKNNGTLTLDAASCLIAPSITGTGTITIDATNLEAGKAVKVIDLNGTESLEGKVTFVGDVVATYGTDGDVTVEKAVAKVGNTCYTSLTDAFKAVTADNDTVEILSDITITEKWDCRNTGSKFSVPVTIIGNDKTIKFTKEIDDGYNFLTAFHFLDDATVKNLTIDMSEAVAVFQNRFSAIANQGDLTVENCTFIGSTTANRCRAIIYGESAANLSEMNVTITGSEFINWGYAVTDNMNGKDAKAVTVADNKFTNAQVVLSAGETVSFTGNTMDESWVTITTYENTEKLNVTATGNTLEENTEAKQNTIQQGNITAQEGFDLPAVEIAGKKYMTIEEAIDKADDGATVTLLEDVDLGETAYELTKSIVLNLNDKKLSGEIKLAEGVTLTADKALMDQVKTAEGDRVYYDKTAGIYKVVDTKVELVNMTLEDSFSLNFWVKKSELKDGTVYTAKLTDENGKELGSVDIASCASDSEYFYVSYPGLAAKEMTRAITMQVFANGVAVSNPVTDSLKANAEWLIENTTDEKLKIAMIDMLNYGAAAQKEFGYNTGNLANAGIAAYQELATKSYDLPNAWTNVDGIGYGSNLELKNEIILHVWFKAADVATVKVNGVEVGPEKITPRIGNSIMSVAVTDLAVADGFDTVTVEFLDGNNNVLGTVTESVASYLKYMLNKSDDTNGLYDATAKFITSAYNYFK